MKKTLLMLLCLCLFFPASLAEESAGIPDLLRFSQEQTERHYLRYDIYTLRTYPQTANEQVTTEMRALIDTLHDRALPALPEKATKNLPAYLDVGATIFRTGQKWMSFLTIARIAHEKEQTYVDFEARAYDMETGKRLGLTDLFAPDSQAWALMEEAVRTQLAAYYPALQPDDDALDALCARESLENAAFTLSPARLTLHFRADSLYPGKQTLMHVKLYFPQIRPLMTETARENTDNSGYKLIALTYDDGGARGSSNSVIDRLRLYGANATFFIVGTTIRNNHDVLCREQDAGYAVESHNYEHVYKSLTDQRIHDWRARFDQELGAVTGSTATCMRAPGGNFRRYIEADVGLPIIQWSVNPSDADYSNYESIAKTVLKHAEPGSVVLMHDLNPLAFRYTELLVPELENRGFLCVTVDELFAHYGVSLEGSTLYYSCEATELAKK